MLVKFSKLFSRHFAAVACVAALLYPTCAGIGAPAEPRIKVALMDFTCDDNSQRSAAAAVDFTVRLQAELSGNDNFDWVERSALAAADKELQLSFLGLTDRSTSLRAGRWAKADLALHGQWSTNTAVGRTLEIEVLDLQRADVLARTNLAFPTLRERPLRVDSQQSAQVAIAVRDLLVRASLIERETRGRPAIALLGVSQGMAMGNPIPGFHSLFREVLAKNSTNAARPFRFVEAIRAGESLDEADLALSGFIDSQEPQRTNAPHFFVWGDLRSSRQIVRDGTERDTATNVLSANFLVLNLAGVMTNFSVQLTNDLSPEHVTQHLAEALIETVHASANITPSEEVRQRASQGLASRAAHLSFSSLSDARSREEWVQGIRWLELACFINPENARARELWTRLRWCDAAYMASANKSRFQKRRSEAWRKYVDKFQFKSVLASSTTPSVASEFILSGWKDFELAGASQYKHREMGVPTDTGGEHIHEWQRQSGIEFATRLTQAPSETLRDQNDMFLELLSQNNGVFVISDAQLRHRALQVLIPQLSARGIRKDCFELLKTHYQQLGQPGGEAALVAAFKAAQAPRPDPVQLPRLPEIDPAECANLLEVPPFIKPIPTEGSVFLKDVGLSNVKEVRALTSQAATLWICAATEENLGQTNVSRGSAESELAGLKRTRGRLFAIDLLTRKLSREASPFRTNDVTSVLAVGPELWVTLGGGFVVRWNPKTEVLQWFGAENGFKVTSPSSLAKDGNTLLLMNQVMGYARLKPDGAAWELLPWNWPDRSYYMGTRWAAGGDLLLVAGGQLVLGDGRSRPWTNVGVLAAATSPGHSIGRVVSLAATGQTGFWVAEQNGIHFVPADAQPSVRSQWLPLSTTIGTARWGGPFNAAREDHVPSAQFVGAVSKRMADRRRITALVRENPRIVNPYRPTSRLNMVPAALAADGDYLWVGLHRRHPMKERDKLALFHVAGRAWVGAKTFPAWMDHLHVADGRVYAMAVVDGRIRCAVADKNDFLSKSREQWFADEPSTEEIEQGLTSLTAHQQAVARFFMGEYDAVVRLLAGRPVELMSSEALFLLAMAHDELGLNQPAERDRYLTLLRDEYPESVYTRYVAAQQKLAEARVLGKARFAAREDSTPTTNSSPAVGFQPYGSQASALYAPLFKDYDCDGSGGLTFDELEALLECEPNRWPFSTQGLTQPPDARVVGDELNARDLNQDGQVDIQDLMRGVSQLRMNSSRIPVRARPPARAPLSTNSPKL